MSSDTRDPEPLLAAISEFREELIGWIDTQLRMLAKSDRERGAWPDDTVAPPSSTPRSSRTQPEIEERSVGMTGSTIPRNARANAPWTDDPPGLRPSVLEPAASRSLSSDQSETVSSCDPRQRLDALARLLDNRLKQSETSRSSGERGVQTDEAGESR